MDHTATIAVIARALRDVPGIKALFLSGSYATRLADDYSDLDFVLMADDGATDAIADLWKSAISHTGEFVLWWNRTTFPVLMNTITRDWTRTDLIILKQEQIKAHTQDTLKPVFDHRRPEGAFSIAPTTDR